MLIFKTLGLLCSKTHLALSTLEMGLQQHLVSNVFLRPHVEIIGWAY